MDKEISLFKSLVHPNLDPVGPGVDTGVIGGMPVIRYESDEGREKSICPISAILPNSII